jgi:hypothetical protein
MTTSYMLDLTEEELFLLIGMLVCMAESSPLDRDLLAKLKRLAEGK